MSVTKKLVTKKFNVHNANKFVDSVSSGDNRYFVYVGKHIPYANGDVNVDAPTDSVQDSFIDVYDNMVFAKLVTTNDVKHMIRRVEWQPGQVYDEYSHDDSTLEVKDFFVYVNDGLEYNVYKCLYNNNGATTVVSPFRVGNSLDYDPIYTGDGYIWKYMYTISKTQFDKFASKTYIPVTPNTDVIANATAGSIEVIKILESGSGYNNYIENGVFKSSDIRVGGIDILYGAPETASTISDYYTGCVLKVTSGSAEGQYRRIVGYNGGSSPKTFTLSSPFNVIPSVDDTYQVYPYGYVFGDGNETTSAEALIVIDGSSSNGVSSIEILNAGAGYRKAAVAPGQTPNEVPYGTTSVFIDLPAAIKNGSSFTEASLKPIIPPKNGHGSDPYSELFANRVCVSVKFQQSENGEIPIENDFRQIGIIKDPEFHNVEIQHGAAVGTFSVGETVKQYKEYKLLGDVTIEAGNTEILKTNFGKISNTITILNEGIGYNSTVNNFLVFSGGGGTGANGYFANDASGNIVSVVVTSQGSGYTSAPTVTIEPTAGGSNGQLLAELANPQQPTFTDIFASGDYILVTNGNTNFVSTVYAVPADYRIVTVDEAPFSGENLNVSAFEFVASGKITAVSTNLITLTNVSGSFSANGKILGLNSGTTAKISTSSGSVKVNDKNTNFSIGVQLSRITGDYAAGSFPFIEDELIQQNTLLPIVQPSGYMHHIVINNGTDDDVLYISNEYGIFNLNRDIVGDSSGTVLANTSNIYKGDFVKGSGEVLYYENLDPIRRSDNKSEVVKIILEF